jgi:hypothetical protein
LTLSLPLETKANDECLKFQCTAIIPHNWGKEAKGQHQLDALLSRPQVDLQDADIRYCKIRSDFVGNNVDGAKFVCDDMTGIRFRFESPAALKKAEFTDCDMSGSDFTAVNGEEIKFRHDTLTKARFDAAKLKGSIFEGGDLKDATFLASDMSGVLFAPDTLPNDRSLARALSLSRIRAPYNEVALFQLRNQFREAGNASQAREITYAIESGRQERYAGECSTGLDSTLVIGRGERLAACGMYSIRALAFSFTCHFGLTPWRPLLLLVYMWVLCTILLFVILASTRKRLVSIAVTRALGGKTRVREYGIGEFREHLVFNAKGLRRLVRSVLRFLRISARLSLVNLFNLQFRDVEVGKWLRMMSFRDYDLKPKGIVRTISGIESILSLYLIALWVLVYFGDPFLK